MQVIIDIVNNKNYNNNNNDNKNQNRLFVRSMMENNNGDGVIRMNDESRERGNVKVVKNISRKRKNRN